MVIQIGIIGAGNIFPAYLNTLRKARRIRVVGIADAQPDVAQARATEFGLKAMSVDELLAGPAQIVLNITPPSAHHPIRSAVLNAGKNLLRREAAGGDLPARSGAGRARIGKKPAPGLRARYRARGRQPGGTRAGRWRVRSDASSVAARNS